MIIIAPRHDQPPVVLGGTLLKCYAPCVPRVAQHLNKYQQERLHMQLQPTGFALCSTRQHGACTYVLVFDVVRVCLLKHLYFAP
jgi:hypothetical protein